MAPRESRRLLGLLAVLAAVAAFSFWPRGSEETRSPAAASRSARGGRVAPGEGGQPLVPVLSIDRGRGDISSKVERNIFAFYVKPTPVPTPPPPPPTPVPGVGHPLFIGPLPLPTPPPPTPIVPPPIPYKAVGIFGPKERPIVAFEDGPRLISAREGDVLDARFVLRRVNRESVDFSFVGLPPDITRRIPVIPPDPPR